MSPKARAASDWAILSLEMTCASIISGVRMAALAATAWARALAACLRIHTKGEAVAEAYRIISVSETVSAKGDRTIKLRIADKAGGGTRR
jgi:hypothetical protein